MARAIRGIDKRQEIAPSLLLRDTRTLTQRLADFFKNPTGAATLMVGLAACALIFPEVSDLIFLCGIGCFLYAYTRKSALPFRLPRRSGLLDYNDPKPGTIDKPREARGITFFGNDLRTNEELWFNQDDMRTHVLIFGSTGSGKTEALVSLAFNSLMHSSGFIYVDGKGDNSLYSKIFSMCRQMGREDDLLLINFMTGARDIFGPQEARISNTLNPFATGSSSMLSQLIVSLMESASKSPDGDMWKGRAITFVEALMRILTYARDQGYVLLDANTIRNYFELSRLEPMITDRQFLRDGQDPVSIENAPPNVIEPLENYIKNLPGYDKTKKGKQVSQVLEQHGFITMQLTRVFTSLSDTYGHILRVKLAEVDLRDVVLNRRILVVLLPALEKSPEELANLGKVVVATLKCMMAAGLGESVEGEYRDVIQRKPTNAPTPFVCVLDEYGYYAVPGFAVVPAQARSLGFSVIFAGQDLPAFQKASKEEAASIGANCNIKICMKLEDPTETWDFFSKGAGEAYVTKVDSFQTRENAIVQSYMDTRSASFEKRARIDLLDLKDQREGEAHIFFKSMIIRAKMFFANPAPTKSMRLNYFVKIDKPADKILMELDNRLSQFEKLITQEDFFKQVTVSDDLSLIVQSLTQNRKMDPIERGVNALLAEHNKGHVAEEAVDTEVEQLSPEELNIFTAIRLSDDQRSKLLTENKELFSQPILAAGSSLAQIQLIERLVGKSDNQAMAIAQEILNDMRQATFYPPQVTEIEATEFLDNAQELVNQIRNERNRISAMGSLDLDEDDDDDDVF